MGNIIMFGIILFLLQTIQDCEFKATPIVAGKCAVNSVKIMDENGKILRCIPCQLCPAGQQPYFSCGSTILKKEILERRCTFCPNGTFSDSYSLSSCKLCKKCKQRSIEIRKCTPTTDTQCVTRNTICKTGFYFSEIFGCLPCSRCCDDDKDIKIDKCVTQGSQSKRFCSVHSVHRCLNHDQNDDENTTQSFLKRTIYVTSFITHKATTSTTPSSNIPGNSNRTHKGSERNSVRKTQKEWILICTSSAMLICTIVIIAFVLKIKCTKKNHTKAQCFPSERLSKSRHLPDKCQSDQSNELEDFSKNDVISGTYSFNCGVSIKYDTDCKQDRYKNLIVEPSNDQHGHFRFIQSGQIFLSPIYKFYSQGEKFENKVKISLPHSALWTSEQKTWDFDILCMDERKGKEAKWEKITDGLEVNWKDVSFKTDTLLTYAVVGKPLKGAKKRMQFVLFTTNEMISDLFQVRIYLLDDNESSYQTVLKETSSKGFTMLGSFYAAFVDCYNSVEIDLNVEGLLDGWELNRLQPKNILSSVCKESYFSIPSFQAVFRRVKRSAVKFSCKFRINVAEKELIIPAFTFVPEEELCVVVDVHDHDYDTSVIKEKKTLFKDLHYDTLYVLGRMLDVSRKGQGTWRQLARDFSLADDELEQFSVEYRTLEGSPSRALFKYLNKFQPKITVGEFAKCLESLGREDAIAVLYEHLKKKQLNSEV